MKTYITLFLILFYPLITLAQWNPVSVPTTQNFVGFTFTDTLHGYLCGNTGTMVKTSDGGSTWQMVTIPTTNLLADISFPTPAIGYSIGDNGTILKTVNGGNTWSLINSPTSNVLRGVYFSDANTGFICGQGEIIYLTTDGGTTWVQKSSGPYWLRQFSFPTPLVGYCAGDGLTIYKTINGGQTWTKLQTGGGYNITKVQFLTVDTGYVCGYGGYVAKSCNGGQTWQVLNPGIMINFNAIWFFNTQTGYLTADAGTILKTINGGVAWSPETSGTTNVLGRMFFFSQIKGFISGYVGTLIKNWGCLPTPGPVSGPANVCKGDVGKIYSVQPIAGAVSYNWSLPAGAVITGGINTNSITVTFTANAVSGAISVYALGASCNSSPSPLFPVNVAPVPAPTITGNVELCVNSGFFDYVTQPGMINYTWTISPGGMITWGSGTNQIQVKWFYTGNQWVAVNYFNANGCNSPDPGLLNVMVDPAPDPAGNVSGLQTLCAGTSNVLYSVDPVLYAATYVWSLPPGAHIVSGNWTNQITVDYDSTALSGKIIVYGNNLCGNGIQSPDLDIQVFNLPTAPVITQNHDTLFSSASSGNQWYFNNSMIGGATESYYIATSDGDYFDVVTINGCSSVNSNVIHFIVTGAETIHSNGNLVISPVPNQGKFEIEFTTRFVNERFTIKIIDSKGIDIYKENKLLVDGQYKNTIDLGDMPQGVYSIILYSNHLYLHRNIIISK